MAGALIGFTDKKARIRGWAQEKSTKRFRHIRFGVGIFRKPLIFNGFPGNSRGNFFPEGVEADQDRPGEPPSPAGGEETGRDACPPGMANAAETGRDAVLREA